MCMKWLSFCLCLQENGTAGAKKVNSEHQQRIREMKEMQKQLQEEKKRIAEQVHTCKLNVSCSFSKLVCFFL